MQASVPREMRRVVAVAGGLGWGLCVMLSMNRNGLWRGWG